MNNPVVYIIASMALCVASAYSMLEGGQYDLAPRERFKIGVAFYLGAIIAIIAAGVQIGGAA